MNVGDSIFNSRDQIIGDNKAVTQVKICLNIVDLPVPLAPNRKKLFDFLGRSVLEKLPLDSIPDLRRKRGIVSILFDLSIDFQKRGR